MYVAVLRLEDVRNSGQELSDCAVRKGSVRFPQFDKSSTEVVRYHILDTAD